MSVMAVVGAVLMIVACVVDSLDGGETLVLGIKAAAAGDSKLFEVCRPGCQQSVSMEWRHVMLTYRSSRAIPGVRPGSSR
jgi:hypothetical protein